VYKRISWKTPGTVCWRSRNARAVQIRDNGYVLDYYDPSLLRPIAQGKASFFASFGDERFVHSVTNCLRALDIDNYSCISFNLFAVDLVAAIEATGKLFDAWDNFARFPEHRAIRERLLRAYQTYVQVADHWTTNSQSNQAYFQSFSGIQNCHLIPNGVDPDRFQGDYESPSDLANIPRPIVGFGAKVTHLLDHELINYLTQANPDVSFVMVGQILEKDVFRKLEKRLNFHYLGDKPYSIYPAYVRSFDLCIIPYVVGDREHGGDSIKFYEYLAAGKWVVTSGIEGITEAYGNTLIAKNAVQFSDYIRQALNTSARSIQLPENLTWKYKADQLIGLLMRPEKTTH
jgi:glycosyltransferase involved in cell wall biosynthesis